jgi:hypothetical protein
VATASESFSQWLHDASLREQALTPKQCVLLQAAFHFRQQRGTDYYSTRLLGHFLLHCDCDLPVAAIARLLGISRPTASRQQGLSSQQVIQQTHHRMDGRPYGKLLPRFAGPIAQFVVTNPQATRYDLLDFIDRTFHVRVSRVALYHFLKKYGLDSLPDPVPAPAPQLDDPATSAVIEVVLPATPPPPPFSSDVPSLLAPSCC